MVDLSWSATTSHLVCQIAVETIRVGAKDQQCFQASYTTILKVHMTALEEREKKARKKATAVDRKKE